MDTATIFLIVLAVAILFLLFVFLAWVGKKRAAYVCPKRYTRAQLELLAKGQLKESGVSASDTADCKEYIVQILRDEHFCKEFSNDVLIANAKGDIPFDKNPVPYEYRDACRNYAKRIGLVK